MWMINYFNSWFIRPEARILEKPQITDEEIERIRKNMPELPTATRARYINEFGLSEYDATRLTDSQIRQHFQLLTREHNLLKDRACSHCKVFNERPPFLGIPFWYSGDSHYCGTCEGCGWYDGVKWREEISKKLK